MRATEFVTELFQPGKKWQWSFTGSQEAVAVFHVGNIPYQFYAYRPDENFPSWDVEFKNADRGKDRTAKFGLTGTGNSAEVMSTIADIMREFLTKYQGKITELTFTADEPSRRALYTRMAKRLLPAWELQQDGKEFKLVAPETVPESTHEPVRPEGYLEGVKKLVAAGVKIQDIPAFDKAGTGAAKVVDTGDRIMAVINIQGVNVPYYISTGEGGKASVPVGKWYPVFGIGPSGWFNKGSEESINKFYGSSILKTYANLLNLRLGDLRNQPVPPMKKAGRTVINQDMLNPQDRVTTQQEAEIFKKRINTILKSIGSDPFYQEQPAKVAENFHDGKKPGRKGLAKRVGVNCKQPVSKLRSIAKNSSGEKQRMAHWCANMKSGKK